MQNKDNVLVNRKEHYSSNQENVKDNSKAGYDANPDVKKAASRDNYSANPQKKSKLLVLSYSATLEKQKQVLSQGASLQMGIAQWFMLIKNPHPPSPKLNNSSSDGSVAMSVSHSQRPTSLLLLT